jgi:phosphonate transport system substrate-binding protein
MTTTLRITSCQAPNSEYIMRETARYLGTRLGVKIDYVEECEWPERYARLDAGDIHAAWICGAPYVRRVASRAPSIELLAAPVWRAPRYGDQPVYFSDVMVRNDHPAQSFADLRGATFAYNEPGSLSGYEAVRFHLAMLGERSSYFGRVVASGSHQRSLRLILAGKVDAAAIDTTVLEEELRADPDLAHHLRAIATLGPSPMPPWVASLALSADLRAVLRQALIAIHEDEAGAAILAVTPVARFAAVSDEDYESVRRMLRLAEQVHL